MNNANISFPLKIAIGLEQTGSGNQGICWPAPNGSSWLEVFTYDFIKATSYVTYILPILQDHFFLNYQMCNWASSENKDV